MLTWSLASKQRELTNTKSDTVLQPFAKAYDCFANAYDCFSNACNCLRKRQEELFANFLATFCSFLRTLTKPLNSLSSQAFAGQWDRALQVADKAILTALLTRLIFARSNYVTSLTFRNSFRSCYVLPLLLSTHRDWCRVSLIACSSETFW